jgi:hypothetical protein
MPTPHLLELKIKSEHHQPNGDQIRLHAEGLAREIQNDVMAKEAEIADAIEHAIRRFATRRRSSPASRRSQHDA